MSERLVPVQRPAGGHHVDLADDVLEDLGVGGALGELFLGGLLRGEGGEVRIGGGEDGVDEFDDVQHVLLHKAAGGDGRGADAEAAGLEGAAAVERNHVLVHGDVGFHEFLLGDAAGEIRELGAEVDEHQVVVRAAGDDVVAAAEELGAHGGRIGDNLLLVGDILRLGGLVEGHGLGGDHMLERTALDAREDAGVEDGAHLLDFALRGGESPRVVEILAHQDDAAARSAEGLVGGGSDDVRVLDRVFQETGGDEAGGMGHVDPEDGAHLVGDLAHAFVVPLAGVGGGAADDELGLALEGLALHLVIVHAAGFRIQAIGHRLVQDAGGVHGRAVGEVSAHGQVQAHEHVPGTEDGHRDGHVGLGAGVGLDIGIFRIVELAETVDGDLLDLVHHFAAAVVTLAGVALRILVGADGAHGGHHLVGNVILRGDELEAGRLAVFFFLDEIEDLEVLFHIVCLVLALFGFRAHKDRFFS